MTAKELVKSKLHQLVIVNRLMVFCSQKYKKLVIVDL